MIEKDYPNLLAEIISGGEAGELTLVATLLDEDGFGEKCVVSGSKGIVGAFTDEYVQSGVLQEFHEGVGQAGKIKVCSFKGRDGKDHAVLIEVLRPKINLLVFGAGHVGQAVALMGAIVGYSVVVYDDREEFLARKRFPHDRINTQLCDFSVLHGNLRNINNSAIVIVTRGHQFDEECLSAVVGSGAAYIGMIGSRRRVLSIYKRLRDRGVGERELQQVHAPIGLRIGAISPQEIAVSILAEVIQVMNSGREEKAVISDIYEYMKG